MTNRDRVKEMAWIIAGYFIELPSSQDVEVVHGYLCELLTDEGLVSVAREDGLTGPDAPYPDTPMGPHDV